VCSYDGKDCGDSVIEGENSERIFVGECAGVDEWSSFTKRAECMLTFEERDEPGDSGEYNAAYENIGGEFRRCFIKNDQSSDACDDADVIERAKEDGDGVVPRDRYGAVMP
jgi:hypothetical protein